MSCRVKQDNYLKHLVKVLLIFAACTFVMYRVFVAAVHVVLTFDLLHTELNINRDHLLIKDYLPVMFGTPGAKFT